MDQEAQSAGFGIEWREGIGIFRIDRSHKLNALTRGVVEGLSGFLTRAESGEARIIVITAAGERAFCAGTDLAEAAGLSIEQQNAKSDYCRDLMMRLAQSPCISIAAINGLAYGGGLELAMACTLRYAASGVMLSLPEIKLGLLPAYGGTQFLTALVGEARALDLILTGRPVDAGEALRMGLISRICDPGVSVVEDAVQTATILVGYSEGALAAARRCIRAAGPKVTAGGAAIERDEASAVSYSADAKEGIAAFLEKRPPSFKRASTPR